MNYRKNTGRAQYMHCGGDAKESVRDDMSFNNETGAARHATSSLCVSVECDVFESADEATQLVNFRALRFGVVFFNRSCT